MLWHQSLKNIHYRTLLIFLNKKNNRFEGQNMGGGIKDMLSPPCQNMGGYITPIPPGFTPLLDSKRDALSSNRKVDGSRLTGSTQACHS